MSVDEVIKKLHSLKNPRNVVGMARFGINPDNTLGVSIPVLRTIAKEVGKSLDNDVKKSHQFALDLWKSGIHEARILSSMIDEPKSVTKAQMDTWVADFDSWDVCDQVCSNLFDKTTFAYDKAFQWSRRNEEFVKRAGYVLMATLAVHNKSMGDRSFEKFFALIKVGATDERNFVKKAVNWALRRIGKRNVRLRLQAIACAHEIDALSSKAAHWIARDALREFGQR